jgi:hypothetical protein
MAALRRVGRPEAHELFRRLDKLSGEASGEEKGGGEADGGAAEEEGEEEEDEEKEGGEGEGEGEEEGSDADDGAADSVRKAEERVERKGGGKGDADDPSLLLAQLNQEVPDVDRTSPSLVQSVCSPHRTPGPATTLPGCLTWQAERDEDDSSDEDEDGGTVAREDRI